MTAMGVGGFGVGFIEKTWGDQIPSLPWVGRKGAVALAIYFLNPSNKILRNVGNAAAAISGYELGSTGKISGEDFDDEDDDDDVMVTE